MTETNKIVPFPKKEIENVFEETLELYREGKIKNLVLIYTVDNYKGYEQAVGNYWFGEKSCLFVLGLIERMKMIVNEYIQAGNQKQES